MNSGVLEKRSAAILLTENYHFCETTCARRQVVETAEGRVARHPLRPPRKRSTTASQTSTGSVCCCHRAQMRAARLRRQRDSVRGGRLPVKTRAEPLKHNQRRFSSEHEHASGGAKAFTASYTLVVKHHSLVAAELKLLQRDVACHHGGFRHRNKHLGQEGARQAALFKHLNTHSSTSSRMQA